MERQQLFAFAQEEPEGDGQRNWPGSAGSSQASSASNDFSTAEGSLLAKVVQKEVIERAYKQVRANKGKPGVDGMTVEAFPAWFREQGESVLQALREGRYQPSAVRRVDIPKPGGKGTRMLGVPTVLDRVIQQAIAIVLGPIFEPTFSESSYGFRPGRSAHGAMRKAQEHVACGFRWTVDLDLSKFFDRVNHDILMSRLARRVCDRGLLRLIRRYLQAGMLSEGVVVRRWEGTPQGSPLSPLLSNILLNEWDQELERRGHRFVRYADDCQIYVRSEKAGQRVMASCVRFLENRLHLKVNVDKSAVDRPWRRKFLGFSVTSGRQPKIRLAPESVERVQDRLRSITARHRGVSIGRMVDELNRVLRGWLGYFRLIQTPTPLATLDSWLRRRLRCFLLKQWRPGKGRRRALEKLGVKKGAGQVSWSRKGPWRLSQHRKTTEGLRHAYFRKLGLLELSRQWSQFVKAT